MKSFLSSVIAFLITSVGSFLVLMIALIIWLSTIPNPDDPSSGAGVGYGLMIGFMFIFPTSLILGLVVSIITFIVKKVKEVRDKRNN